MPNLKVIFTFLKVSNRQTATFSSITLCSVTFGILSFLPFDFSLLLVCWDVEVLADCSDEWLSVDCMEDWEWLRPWADWFLCADRSSDSGCDSASPQIDLPVIDPSDVGGWAAESFFCKNNI